MKNSNLIQSLGLAAAMAVSAGAFAHGNAGYHEGFDGPAFQQSLRWMNKVNERQDRQMDRILNGFYDRNLNPREFSRLMEEQRDIQRMEHEFLADGLLTPSEFRQLIAALNSANRNIYREKHDEQRRPDHDGWHSSYGYGR